MSVLPELLKSLEGKWKGRGIATFPTTGSYAYEEETDFTLHPDRQVVHYLQRSWLIDDMLNRIRPSHFETGFISFNDNDQVILNNAQTGGRIEAMSGKITGNKVALTSDVVTNDVRMISTSRVLTIDNNTLIYETSMHTKDVQSKQLHLSATLNKVA